MPSDFHDPVASDVPVLLIAGEIDVATPAWMAERAAETLAHGELVVFANSSHWDMGGADCYDGIVTRFMADPSAPVEASCAGRIERPPFEIVGSPR